MNTQMMEGLLGASSGLRLSGTPMSVYRQAAAEGDAEKMKRALGYTGACAEQAARSQEKLDKGMKAEAEAKARREQAELDREAAVEKRREERRRTEEGGSPDRPRETDSVRLSQAAQAALKNSRPAGEAEPPDSEPVLYTPSGEITSAPAEEEQTVSFFA